jgi:hypothetical protein
MQYRLGDAICEKERVEERGKPSLDFKVETTSVSLACTADTQVQKFPVP